MVEWIMLFMVLLLFNIMFIMYRQLRTLGKEVNDFYKNTQVPYKTEPVPKENQDPEHELQAEMEVDEDTYNRMMAEWMGLTSENDKGKEGQVNGE